MHVQITYERPTPGKTRVQQGAIVDLVESHTRPTRLAYITSDPQEAATREDAIVAAKANCDAKIVAFLNSLSMVLEAKADQLTPKEDKPEVISE